MTGKVGYSTSYVTTASNLSKASVYSNPMTFRGVCLFFIKQCCRQSLDAAKFSASDYPCEREWVANLGFDFQGLRLSF
jgi:hypothetical protein